MDPKGSAHPCPDELIAPNTNCRNQLSEHSTSLLKGLSDKIPPGEITQSLLLQLPSRMGRPPKPRHPQQATAPRAFPSPQMWGSTTGASHLSNSNLGKCSQMQMELNGNECQRVISCSNGSPSGWPELFTDNSSESHSLPANKNKSINQNKQALETLWRGGYETVWAQVKLTFLSIITGFIKHALKHVKAGHQRGKSPA